MSHTCPVCGYPDLRDPTRMPNSGGGSHEICPSCRFQFGVTDDDRNINYKQWREQWIKTGMVWDRGSSNPPSEWNPKQQLLNIGFKLPED